MRWSACADRRRRRGPPARSRDVTSLGRRVARLRLLEETREIGVAHLDECLLAPPGAVWRVARDAHLAIRAAAGDEQERELVAVVLRDAARWHHLPAPSGEGNRAC